MLKRLSCDLNMPIIKLHERTGTDIQTDMTKGKATAAFRTRFKDAILAVNARGFGEALIATGNPIAGWVLAPDDGDLPGWEAPY